MTPAQRSYMNGYVSCMLRRPPPKRASLPYREGYRTAVRERIWRMITQCEALRFQRNLEEEGCEKT